MSEPLKPVQELQGWKEIAGYLGVSVRTAQTLEDSQGLPVQRRGVGKKAPVSAISTELEAWRTNGQTGVAPEQKPKTEERQGDASEGTAPAERQALYKVSDSAIAEQPPGFVTANRPMWPRYALGVGLLVLTIGTAFYYGVVVPHGPPSDFRVDGKNLVVFNAKGKELWRHTFPKGLAPGSYGVEVRRLRNWLSDLDGDGQVVLLFTVEPENWSEVGSTLACFGPGGKIRWQFTPGRQVTDASGDHMTPPYIIHAVEVLAGKTPADTRIAVSSVHYVNQPDQVAILDVHGRVLGEYWHPGHLNFLAQADLDGDGTNELLAAGVNNGDHQATLVVLNPWEVSGLMTPVEMTDERFRLVDMPPAKERAVVLFPRSCVSKGQAYTRVASLVVHKDRIVLVVAEQPAMDGPGFIYELGYSLQTLTVVAANDFVRTAHHKMEALGELDHPLSADNNWQRLKTGVIVQRGK
jgi:hypothetical protein